MPIVETVSTQMKEAMRAKDKLRLNVLRSMRTAFLNEMKKDNSEEVSDEVCVSLLRKLEKQRKESIDAFEKAGREEQTAAERAELLIIQEFLPQLADEEQTRVWVQEAIASSGAEQPGDMGRVMGAMMKAHKGEIDGTLAKNIAAELLSS
jgi:uncharacterized protein YqeY